MTSEKPKYSVIITVHDQSDMLESNLPRFLIPQGDISFEVIVVDDSSTDDTPNVLTRMRGEYSNLYNTFLPVSDVPIPSRLRLGLTIGVKASHGQWIIFSDISRPPVLENWLEVLSANIDGRSDVVLGYDNKSNTIQSFENLDEAKPYLCKAERRSGCGHKGRFLRFQRGLYNVMTIKKEYAHDAIKLFDQPVKGSQLTGLRFKVLFNNLF